MISKNTYEQLKKEFGHLSSWAVWQEEGDTPKSNTGDMSIFDSDNLLDILNPNYVFVALNPAGTHGNDEQISKDYWVNFHSSYSGQNDFKLRYALKGTKYWGAYITDIIKTVKEVHSENVSSYLKQNPNELEINVELFEKEISILDTKPILIALGDKAYKILKKTSLKDKYTIIKIPHYSARGEFANKEDYRKEVLSILDNI